MINPANIILIFLLTASRNRYYMLINLLHLYCSDVLTHHFLTMYQYTYQNKIKNGTVNGTDDTVNGTVNETVTSK